MPLSFIEKIALGLSGATAVGVGTMILLWPHAFYASYGITLGDDPSLLSELRALAAGLTTLGTLMLLGIWRSGTAQLAVASTLVVFVAFPFGRLISFYSDGLPSGGIIAALTLEIIIAVFCIFAFRRRLFARTTQS